MLEELFSGKANPPLAGLPIGLDHSRVKDTFNEPRADLATNLSQILSQLIGVVGVLRLLKIGVQWEVGLTGQRERLQSLTEELVNAAIFIIALSELLEAEHDIEHAVDEDAIGRALDLERREEYVGLKEVEAFVDDVGFGVVGGRCRTTFVCPLLFDPIC